MPDYSARVPRSVGSASNARRRAAARAPAANGAANAGAVGAAGDRDPATIAGAGDLTPAMRQWAEQKAAAGDALLLFRMGDFYELFYDDARRAAKLLNIVLTSRDNGRTPMAGIPHHALESYLRKLVAAGCKVAISEQVADPRQARGVIRRAIQRVVTPGTLTDEGLLDGRAANIVAAVWPDGPRAGVAALELSTGEFEVLVLPAERVPDELFRLGPAEVLLPDGEAGAAGNGPGQASGSPAPLGDLRAADESLSAALRERGVAVTRRAAAEFGAQRAEQTLREQFATRVLEGFGFRVVDASLQAAGAVLLYVQETQKATAAHIRPPRRRAVEDHMALDPTTLRALEVEQTLRGGTLEGSLLDAVDRTCNPMGARLLRQWLCYPLRRVEDIRWRQEVIGALRSAVRTRAELRRALRDAGDIGRMIGRLGVQRTHPRDLRALGDGLAKLAGLRAGLRALACSEAAALATRLEGVDPLAEMLCATLRPEAPLALREGGIFVAGHHPELDRLRALQTDGQRWLSEFEAREIERSGIHSLKVGYNRVFGYYIEITHAHRTKAPADYVRRQTVKNAERYITDELKRHEDEVLSAQAKANELEYDLFVELRQAVGQRLDALQRVAAALAELDVLAGWAELAHERGYTRPEFVAGRVLEIEAGRHPVVEQVLDAGFVANDTRLAAREVATAGGRDAGRSGAAEPAAATADADGIFALALITGPNMAGKSTYIRQVALLALLAHCGCWTPAKRMRLGVVDRIFTRVGAADELARGQSTFMVEMVETANILHNATADSLVILDEVGRGTSTFDGLALAWAISEHLALRTGCRTLFATHYHELTELAELLDPVCNLNVAVKEYEDQIVFLHRIVPGAADRSYGVHVARLAGVPRGVLERANEVLNELEKTFARESQRPVLAAVQRRRQRQLRLFEAPEEAVVRELRDLAPERLDPAAAVERIRAWRRALGLGDGGGAAAR